MKSDMLTIGALVLASTVLTWKIGLNMGYRVAHSECVSAIEAPEGGRMSAAGSANSEELLELSRHEAESFIGTYRECVNVLESCDEQNERLLRLSEECFAATNEHIESIQGLLVDLRNISVR